MFTLETAATAAYVVAALLFIMALAGLSKHETSRSGNTFGMAGMGVALVATIVLAINKQIEPLGLALLIGGGGLDAAQFVEIGVEAFGDHATVAQHR